MRERIELRPMDLRQRQRQGRSPCEGISTARGATDGKLVYIIGRRDTIYWQPDRCRQENGLVPPTNKHRARDRCGHDIVSPAVVCLRPAVRG